MEKETRKRKGVADGIALALEEDNVRVRTPVETESSVVITAQMINTELTCPICLGIIRNCTTVMECLHRFCLDCIEKSLRLGRKQCPSCRVACPSRRNLRQDGNFDALVAKIYPDIKKAEATLQRLTLSMIKAQNHGAFAKAMEDGMVKQKEKSRRGYVESTPAHLLTRSVAVNREETPPVSSSAPKRTGTTADENLPLSVMQMKSVINVWLHRRTDSPQSPALNKYSIRTSRLLTVDQLQRYLALKLESKVQIVLYASDSTSSQNGTTSTTKNDGLRANLTLGAVDVTIWKKPAPMILYYASFVSAT